MTQQKHNIPTTREMTNAINPETPRELTIMLIGRIDQLSTSIDGLGERFEKFEEIKISAMEKELDELKDWRNEWMGAWRFIVVATGFLTIASLIFGILVFFKK